MNYIKLLQEHNLKVTPQRLEIVDILNANGHLSIDLLYENLKQKFPSLSLATIYKNINTMCEKLFLSEVKLPNKKTVYELIKTEHSHVVCTKCNNIMDVNLNINEVLNEATNLSSYAIEQSNIVFQGICPNCKS